MTVKLDIPGLADAIDPRIHGIDYECWVEESNLIAASDALRSMVKRLEMLTPRNPHIRPGNTE